ncbi:MAG: hypothetical protein WCY00_02140 [Candidatus Dojkabacteria bacterium]|jgi:hypothetical protein
MPEHTAQMSNIISNLLKIFGGLLLILLYTIFLSPHVESLFVDSFSTVAQGYSTQELNKLSPIFDIHVYAGEYNLASSFDHSTLKGRTRFLTLDSRILAMNKFLTDYQSPMANYADVFVSEADRHGLDWRLIASISGVESAFGNLIPRGTHNGWGWRGRNRNPAGWSIFESWEEAISHITERMALGYGTDLTPYDIESTYCPPCGETGLHLWANGVTRFMNELEYYADNLDNL